MTPDPVKLATEGALWGSIREQGLLEGTVIVSDDAGQFRVGQHALCWVHAERLVHKLIPFNERQRRAVELVRQLIWWFYADLKAYKRDPCRKAELPTNHRGPVIRLRLGKRLALEWARGERPMPLWWRRTPDTNLAHGLRRA